MHIFIVKIKMKFWVCQKDSADLVRNSLHWSSKEYILSLMSCLFQLYNMIWKCMKLVAKLDLRLSCSSVYLVFNRQILLL